jgi:hypothetical protein
MVNVIPSAKYELIGVLLRRKVKDVVNCVMSNVLLVKKLPACPRFPSVSWVTEPLTFAVPFKLRLFAPANPAL